MLIAGLREARSIPVVPVALGRRHQRGDDGPARRVLLAMLALLVLPTGLARGEDLVWTERAVIGPAPRYMPSMAYDAARRVTVLHGGGITWEWDGTTWSAPTAGERFIYGHAMAYDTGRRVTVLAGFSWGSGVYSRTYESDGTGWIKRDVLTPDLYGGGGMAYDAARGVTVLFTASGQTWEWDGTTWTQRLVACPVERWGAAMVYDAVRRVSVLFGGGRGKGEVSLADTWEWDGSTWTQRLVAGPSARWGYAMAYDGARGVTVLFGGGNDEGARSDTWEWDGAEWTQRMIDGPPACVGVAMAYDATRKRMVLFGGCDPHVWELGAVCRADLNNDGSVDFSDYLEFLNLYDAGDGRADFNGDGLVDFSDYLEFLTLYDAGC